MANMQEIVRLITGDGWQIIVMHGPHWQFVHPTKPGRITVSAHLNHEVGQGTVKSIIKQANVSLKEGKHHGAVLSRH